MSRHLTLSLFALLLFCLPAANAFAQREPLSDEELAFVEEHYPNAQKIITGVRYVIDRPGTGENARSGDVLTVLYKGMLLNGTVFNEALDRDKPFTFRLGRGLVIEGWDQVLKRLNEGCKATLIIPWELAYGTRGNSPAVPPRATLIFEVEILKIERGSSPAPLATTGDKKSRK